MELVLKDAQSALTVSETTFGRDFNEALVHQVVVAYAAGAMMFVVVEELIPESQTNGNTDVATLGLMVGFVIMMVMDVALG